MSDEQDLHDDAVGQDAPEAADVSATVVDEAEGGPREAQFSEVQSTRGARVAPMDASLDRVYDLTVPVTVEVGRTNLSVQEILQLAPGSVVELDHAADAPVELLVHGKCVAKGEIVVVDDFYGVRITAVGEA